MGLNQSINRFNIEIEVASDLVQVQPQWRNGSAADL